MVYLDTRFRSDILQIDFTIVSTSPIKTAVKWALVNQPDTESPFAGLTYNLYFNQVPNRHMVRLNDSPLTEPAFEHNTAKYIKLPRGYYQVEAIDADGGTLMSRVWDLYAPFDNISNKMSKEALFGNMHVHGHRIEFIPALIYARKGFGSDKCPKCTVTGLGPLKSKCPVCLGTGFTGGYHYPVLTFLGYSQPFSKNRSDQGNRRAEEAPNILESVGEICIIDIDDYIRELLPPQRLFCVSAVSNQFEYGGRPIKQYVSLQLEESGHPLWAKAMPTVEIPKIIHYRKCREIYERIVDSFDQGAESAFGEFPQHSTPQAAREADGTVVYRGYP